MRRSIRWAMAREALAFVLALCGFLVALHLCAACSPAKEPAIKETIENAAAVAQYKVLLSECRAIGKDAGSYAAYERCADALDANLCRTRSLRCTDAGAP